MGSVDVVTEVVLEHLEDGLDSGPAGVAAHVNDNSEAQVSNILAEMKHKIRSNENQSLHDLYGLVNEFPSNVTTFRVILFDSIVYLL